MRQEMKLMKLTVAILMSACAVSQLNGQSSVLVAKSERPTMPATQ